MWSSLHAQDFIQLPPLGEAGTLTLIDELEAAANAAAWLPEGVTEALGLLVVAGVDLQKTMAGREKAGSAADPRARAADRALDDAWGAFQSWLLGWTRLPEKAHPLIADARALYRALFPKGLQFLTLEFKDEWNESQQRLDHLKEARLDEIVDQMGGGAFLMTLAHCHRAYGDVLQITRPQNADAIEPDALVRRALDASHMALRDYVAQVAATVRRTDNDSIEMAGLLLLPLSVRAGSNAP
ncbi:MAG TPA: hypothetical protein VLT33_11840 [Labilithrix sp.]|nr:hypothetical protein [Labilithrix sp.]